MISLKKLHRIVVLGTGTDVGKTYVGTQLAEAWREKHGPVLGLKPIESGLSPDDDATRGDAVSLSRSATEGHPPVYSFPDPISPHLAARRMNREISLVNVTSWIADKERSFCSTYSGKGRLLSIVETAGGVFSPTSKSATNADLALGLDPALWILVAPDSLGVLHDIQATIRGLGSRSPDLVVLSRAREADASTGTNAGEIESIVFPQLSDQAPRCTVVPVVDQGGSAKNLLATLDGLLL